MSRITRAILALVVLALAAPASAAAAPTLVPVGNFSQPIYLTAPPKDTSSLFVVEKSGAVSIVRGGQTLAALFLDISSEVDDAGERGLLSMAFAPDYASSGLFYVYLTASDPLGELQVREYRRSAADPDRADPAGRIVWRQSHDQAANHNGGQIEFGPDGLLWLATGDGGGSNNQFGHARDLSSQLGKVLRIDPRPGNAGSYTVPADNPYGSAVWAYGLRNPFRFSFDHRGTGDLIIGDVGQGAREEIDWVRSAGGLGKRADFGWACREGTVRPQGVAPCDPDPAAYVPPVLEYSRSSPVAVTGGVVVRDPGLPTLVGRYLYADFYEGVVHSVRLAWPRVTDNRTEPGLQRGQLAAFGEDACGHVYVVSLSGSVHRIQDGALGPCVLRPDPPTLNPGPPAAPGGPAAPAGPDRTSPRVSIRVARKGRVGRRATPRIQITASENCRVTISARLAGTTLKRVRTPLRGGRRTIVRLRPKAKAIKRIQRALRRRKRVTMVVTVAAVDAAGNRGRVQRRLKVRRG